MDKNIYYKNIIIKERGKKSHKTLEALQFKNSNIFILIFYFVNVISIYNKKFITLFMKYMHIISRLYKNNFNV